MTIAGLFFALGALYAIFAPPQYVARVEIFPKDPNINANKSTLLGGLSGLGLNPSQNSNISQIQILLKGQELAETVIRKKDLMPHLYPGKWDKEKGAWKKGERPSLREGVAKLQGMISVTSQPKYMLLEVEVRSREADLSFSILESYLESLHESVRRGALKNLEANRRFLDSQLTHISDPMLRERVQELNATQIESALFLGATAFDMPEGPHKPWRPEKPKRVRILIFSILIGCLASCALVLAEQQIRQVVVVLRNEAHDTSST